MKSFWGGFFAVVLIFLVLVCCVASVCILPFALAGSVNGGSNPVATLEGSKNYSTIFGEDTASHKLLAIKISGTILTERTGEESIDLLGGGAGTYGYEIKRQLMDAATDDSLEGIILEISSPGGTIGGATAITDGVEYYKEKTGKPVVAHITDLGASGGYWAAISGDYVMANAGSSVGSIGVIFGPFTYYNQVLEQGSIFGNVVTQNGIETTYITAGQYKDLGNPYRKVTEAEREVLQNGVNKEYDNFVSYVGRQRNLTSETIRTKIKALIYSTQQAVDLKLIDKEASKEEAYAELAKRANLTEDYKIVREVRAPGFWESLFSAAGLGNASKNAQAQQTKTCKLCNQMLYLYGSPLEYLL